MDKFVSWIEKAGGPDKVGKKLGVTGFAVRVWIRGAGFPKAATMKKIVRITRNRVTFTDIMTVRK